MQHLNGLYMCGVYIYGVQGMGYKICKLVLAVYDSKNPLHMGYIGPSRSGGVRVGTTMPNPRGVDDHTVRCARVTSSDILRGRVIVGVVRTKTRYRQGRRKKTSLRPSSLRSVLRRSIWHGACLATIVPSLRA